LRPHGRQSGHSPGGDGGENQGGRHGSDPSGGHESLRAANISGVPVEHIAREAIPFVLVLVAELMVLTYVPELITFLPNLLLK
jgi:hypothetical protein